MIRERKFWNIWHNLNLFYLKILLSQILIMEPCFHMGHYFTSILVLISLVHSLCLG